MMRYLILLQLLWLVLIASCGGGAGGVGQFLAKGDAPAVSSVDFVNDQLVINGSNLAGVTSVSVEGENFNIESISNNQLVVNAQQALAFIAGASYNLLVSNAFGAATYSITFTPDNNSITTNMIVDSAITTNKIADEAITESKLSDMGASDGDFLQWDQATTSWIPTTLNGLTYLGTWDATTAAPSDPAAGEYYVVSVAGDTDLGSQVDPWSVGDWAIYNGSDWQKIDNSNAVTNVFGRQGAITGVEGDYNIDLLGDVDTTTATPADGQVLTWDQAGGNWVPATESDPKVGTLTNGKWCTTDGNVINCEAAPGAETDPIFGGHVASSITDSGSGVVISVAERNGITNNASSISTNATNIATNDSDIATNVTNISTNAGNISSNDTDIATNVTNISTNATNISSNDTDIATNVTNISTNATNISSNDTDIATNVTNISTNAGNISSNDSDIAAQATAISGKVTAAGEAGGQTIIGGTADNENLTLISSSATPGDVLLNPAGGNVGIGTTASDRNLLIYQATGNLAMEIEADDGVAIFELNGNQTTDAGVGSITFSNNNDSLAVIQSRREGANDAGNMLFFTQPTGSTAQERMRITSTGNVGIGSDAPAAILDVAGAINAQQLCDENGANCFDLDSGAIAVSGDVSASGGNVSVGTTDATYNITFEGDTDQTIGVLEQSTGAGSSLTINSGAAQTGSTDQNGGNLVLSSGSSTGNGGSAIEFKTASSSGTPGTTVTATPSTKMVILEDGSVGIGTTSPAHMLEVNDTGSSQGTMQITRAAAPFIRFKSGTTGVARLQAPTTTTMAISDYNGVNNHFAVDTSSGNVGIGTTAPETTVDINSSVANVPIKARVASSYSHGNGIWFQRAKGNLDTPTSVEYGDSLGTLFFSGYHADSGDYNNYGAVMKAVVDGTPGNDDMPTRLEFWTTPEGANWPISRMTIDNSGNVGVGTTDPIAPLHVVSNASSYTMLLSGETGMSTAFYGNLASHPVTARPGSRVVGPANRDMYFELPGNESTDRLSFITQPDGTSGSRQESVVINNAGNVGIGTSAPIRSLHLSKATNNEIILEQSDALADYRKWNFLVNGGSGVAASNFHIRQLNDAANGGNYLLSIHGTSGNVGIGSIIPTAKLDVQGGNLVIGAVSDAYGISFRADAPNGQNVGVTSGDVAGNGNNDGLILYGHDGIELKYDNGSSTAVHIDGIGDTNPGYVGIGTISPSSKLEVDGNVKANAYLLPNSGYEDWAVSTTQWYIYDVSAGYSGIYRIAGGNSSIMFSISEVGPAGGGRHRDQVSIFMLGSQTQGGTDGNTRISQFRRYTFHDGGGNYTETKKTYLAIQVTGTNDFNSNYSIETLVGDVLPASSTDTDTSGHPTNLTYDDYYDISFGDRAGVLGDFYAAGIGEFRPSGDTSLKLRNMSIGGGSTSGTTGLWVGDAGSGVNTLTREKITANTSATVLYHEYGYNTQEKSAQFDHDNVIFYTQGTQRMRVDSSGNVGIGKTSPQSKLHILAQSGVANHYLDANVDTVLEATDARLQIVSLDDGFEASGMILSSASATPGTQKNWAITHRGPNNNNRFGIGYRANSATEDIFSTMTEQFTILTGGNVGIGTVSPGYKLEVNGQPAANGYTAFTNSSDRRLKRDIESFEDGALEKILGIRPATFFYNELTGYDEETRNRKMYGVIAQELREIFPEMVDEFEIDGEKYLNTNMGHLPLYIVKAMQEQNQTIVDLEEKSAKMEEENRRIVEENKKIKTENKEIKEFLCSKFSDAPMCN